MTATKNLGIWMDHAGADLMEPTVGQMETKTITSKFTHEEKEESLVKSENLMHHKDQHEEAEYYKELGTAIRSYDNVLLFGPTNAKAELLNILRADNLFAKIKIELKTTDKMTENQKHAFVREYFAETDAVSK